MHRAERLRKSVDPLLPRLTADCEPDRFDKLREALEEVRGNADDDKALDHVSRWADPIVRAYSGLLHFYLEPKTPVLAVAPFPGGDISYVPLNDAPREAHIAVQQCDDPRRLLLGYLDWARKGYHFYATGSGLYCSGRSPDPPEEFLTAQLHALPYHLQATDAGRYECPHLARREPAPYLGVSWPAANRTFRVCRQCLKGDRQLLASVTQGLAIPKAESAFGVEASLNVDCRGGPNCVHASLPGLPRGLEKRYLFGKLSDSELLKAYREELAPRFRASGAPVFVAAGHCFGSDPEAFLEALSPTPEEKRALDRVLPYVQGLFELDEASASRALERLWTDHASEIVEAIVDDPKEAERIVREARANPGRVSELLKRAARAAQEERVLAELPRYHSLSPEAEFVDSVARTFRSQGAKPAEKVLLQTLPREGKERGIGFGLLLVLEADRPHTWQFSDTERQFGTALAPFARAVLNCPASEYNASLGTLLSAAGVTDWGVVATPA